jgi:hypothetical protein
LINYELGRFAHEIRMKLPRWLVVSLLSASVLALLGLTGFWWMTRPKRIAFQYLELERHGKVEAAEQLLGHHYRRMYVQRWEPEGWQQIRLKALPRKWVDILLGRQTFRMVSLELSWTDRFYPDPNNPVKAYNAGLLMEVHFQKILLVHDEGHMYDRWATFEED